MTHPDLTQRPPRSARVRLGGFVSGAIEEAGGAEREDLATWFEWLDYDDFVSFGGV